MNAKKKTIDSPLCVCVVCVYVVAIRFILCICVYTRLLRRIFSTTPTPPQKKQTIYKDGNGSE